MFQIGDMVNIIFPKDGDYTGGIRREFIHEAIANNPYTVVHIERGFDWQWCYLSGVSFAWGSTLLELYTDLKNPDWEI